MNDISFLINCLFFTIQTILSVFFIDQYLIRKYGIKSFIYGVLIMLILVYLVMSFLYTNIPLRMVFGVLFFEIISWLLYDGKIIKKLLTGPILFICLAFSEFFTQIILVFLLDISIFTNLSPVSLFILMFFNTITISIVILLFLHFFSHSFLSTPQYSKLIFSSITVIFLMTVILSESLFMSQLFFVKPNAAHYNLSIVVSLICFVLSLLLNIYIYHSIKSLKKDIYKETISQALSDEYLLEMNHYLNVKKEYTDISYLRHDIINYIETILIYQKKEDSSNVTKD